MIKYVLFDLDDTLYPEIQYVCSGFRAVAAFLHQNRTAADPEYIFQLLWHTFENGPRNRVFNLVLEQLHIKIDSSVILDI